MSKSGWCTIESDPGVFTELIEKIGVKGVQVEEIISLDREFYQQLEPIYGLIFLFKYIPEHKTDSEVVDREFIWFAKQVIQNACATQALLSILFNSDSIELGEAMTALKMDTLSFDSETKGMSIGNADVIRQVHNSFARPEPFELGEAPAKSGDDVYHFVSYLPIDGRLYELDGLQAGPIDHGVIESGNWLEEASAAIKKRIAKYEDELGFTILAVVQNLREKYAAEYQTLAEEKSDIAQQLSGNLDDITTQVLESRLPVIEEEMATLEAKISEEVSKFSNWTEENTRRRHNYIPMLFNFLRILAEKNKLIPLLEKAKERKAAQQQ